MKVKLHPTVERISGKLDGITYRWMYGKQTAMKTPDTPHAGASVSKIKWSKAQKTERGRFAQAIAYARQAIPLAPLRGL